MKYINYLVIATLAIITIGLIDQQVNGATIQDIKGELSYLKIESMGFDSSVDTLNLNVNNEFYAVYQNNNHNFVFVELKPIDQTGYNVHKTEPTKEDKSKDNDSENDNKKSENNDNQKEDNERNLTCDQQEASHNSRCDKIVGEKSDDIDDWTDPTPKETYYNDEPKEQSQEEPKEEEPKTEF
jgi:hypothetical protein